MYNTFYDNWKLSEQFPFRMNAMKESQLKNNLVIKDL